MSELWAITSYFNPMRYQRRLANYRAFRRRLAVPLLTVELAYGTTFELGPDAADTLIQLRGRDVLWQKERLLNVALHALPAECRMVAWLDSDIIFARDDWVKRSSELLDHFVLVQPFQTIFHLKDTAGTECLDPSAAEATERSLGYHVAIDRVPPFRMGSGGMRQTGCARGVAWVGRRDVLQRHGLYDACILGGGDTAISCAALGVAQSPPAVWQMNARQTAHYLAWAEPFTDTVGRRISYVDGDVFHLWHGDVRNRQYRQRHLGLQPFHFDPVEDIAIDGAGCWRWSSDKPELHRYVERYFATRNEDGEVQRPPV